MTALLLHPRSAALLAQLAQNPPQALLLTGPEGSGKRFTARSWLLHDLAVNEATIRHIEPEKTGISVGQIRDLYHATRAKQTERIFFILEDASSMSIGAQNAFLKLLEEPNHSIYFILTAHSPEAMLPTIRSRAQHVALAPLSDQTLYEHLQTLPDMTPATVQQIVFVAKGRVGLAQKLAQDPEALATYRSLATQAKQFLTSTPFERLATLSGFSDRTQATTFLELAAAMASSLLQRATTQNEQRLWVARISKLHDTLERLTANANLKAQLTRLALSL